MKRLPVIVIALALALGACSTAPSATIPDPLPEALDWARPVPAEGQAFLGLKTREHQSGALDSLLFLPGVRVNRVVEGSPAAEAGFLVGDVVLRLQGGEVADPEALDARIRSAVPGDVVWLEVQRDDTVFEVPVRLRPRGGEALPEPEALYHLDPARSNAAWSSGRAGAVLVSSSDAAPFPSAGVPVGSVVLAIDGAEVVSARGLIRALGGFEPGAQVEVLVRDAEGSERLVSVELYDVPTRVTDVTIPILANYAAKADGSESEFTLVDLWAIWLFRYQRDGEEREWSFLRFFSYSTGVGELAE